MSSKDQLGRPVKSQDHAMKSGICHCLRTRSSSTLMQLLASGTFYIGVDGGKQAVLSYIATSTYTGTLYSAMFKDSPRMACSQQANGQVEHIPCNNNLVKPGDFKLEDVLLSAVASYLKVVAMVKSVYIQYDIVVSRGLGTCSPRKILLNQTLGDRFWSHFQAPNLIRSTIFSKQPVRQ